MLNESQTVEAIKMVADTICDRLRRTYANTTVRNVRYWRLEFHPNDKKDLDSILGRESNQAEQLALQALVRSQLGFPELVAYAPEEDRNGRSLRPGDRVRFKLYPRGTAEGVVVISKRTMQVLPNGEQAPALAIESDGTVYDLYGKGTLKLKK